MAKAYWINSADRQISEVEFDDTGIADIIRYVACGDTGFDLGWSFNGDPLYVDDEGLFKPQAHFFQIIGRPDGQPLPGNALVTGRDRMDDRGSDNPRISLDDLKSRIRFLSRAQADAWSVKMAKKAASSINGEMVSSWEQLWREMPQPIMRPSVWLQIADDKGGGRKQRLPSVWTAVDLVRQVSARQRAIDLSQPVIRFGPLTEEGGALLLTEAELLEACR